MWCLFFFMLKKNRHHNSERHHRSAHTLHLTVVWANRTTRGWLRVKFVCSAPSRTKLIARSSPDFGVGNDESIGYYRADLRTRSLKGSVPVVRKRSRGDPPGTQTTIIMMRLYLGEFSELSKILPDLEFSDRCLIQVSRVLDETFSSRRNICSKLKMLLRS